MEICGNRKKEAKGKRLSSFHSLTFTFCFFLVRSILYLLFIRFSAVKSFGDVMLCEMNREWDLTFDLFLAVQSTAQNRGKRGGESL